MEKVKEKFNSMCIARYFYIFIVLYTCYRFVLDNKEERISQFAFFIVSTVYSLFLLLKRKKDFFNKKMIFGFLFIFFGIITIIINKEIDFSSLRAIFMLYFNFILFFVNDDFSNADYKVMLKLIFIVTLIHSYISLLGGVTDVLGITNFNLYRNSRLFGPIYVTYTGEMALMCAGISLYYIFNGHKKNNKDIRLKCFHIVNTAVQIAIMVLAQSRCSLYGFFIVLFYCIVVYLIKSKKVNYKILLSIILLIVFFVLFLYLIMSFSGKFMIRKVGFYGSKRFELWAAYIDVFKKQNMIFGMGPTKFINVYRNTLYNGGFEAYLKYFGDYSLAGKHFESNIFFSNLAVHNEYIREMILFGVIGLLIFISFIIYVIHILLKMVFDKNYNNISILFLCGFFIIYPLFSAFGENMFSITNSPRFLINICFFLIIKYIFSNYNVCTYEKNQI